MSITLSDQVLDRFWRASENAGAPVGQLRRPGLGDSEVSALGAELGLTVPPELRTLWGHSAAPAPGIVGPVGACELTADYGLFSPEAAVSRTKYLRSIATPEYPFPPSWLEFAEETAQNWLVVDCAEQESVSPVYYTVETGAVLASHSLGALFERWTEQIERGEVWFEHDRWIADFDVSSRFTREELGPEAKYWRLWTGPPGGDA